MRLQTPVAAAVLRRGGSAAGRPAEYDQVAMIMRIQVLKRRDGHIDSGARRVHYSFHSRILVAEKRVEGMRVIGSGRSSSHYRFGVLQEIILPGAAGVCVAEDFRRSPEGFGALDNSAIASGALLKSRNRSEER